MIKNSIIFDLLQNVISQEEIKVILAEFGFEDPARKCDVSTRLAYLYRRQLICSVIPIVHYYFYNASRTHGILR